MPTAESVETLTSGRLSARVLPDEGGLLSDLRVDGRPVLARTPWADDVAASPHPAPDEEHWVRRWRGGWQVCLPTAGQPDPRDPRQGFHGAASQAPWRVVEATPSSVVLAWSDPDGLTAERRWLLEDDTVLAFTTLRNDGDSPRDVVVAEHLVLGQTVLEGPLKLHTDARGLQPLDYDGRPVGDVITWPGGEDERWTDVDEHTPARVGGLVDASTVSASGAHVEVAVAWEGLPHALAWEELVVTTDAPWDGGVRALGLEPSSVPHGAGTAGDGAVRLEPGATLDWRVTLTVTCPDGDAS